jgi:hypothetical protein
MPYRTAVSVLSEERFRELVDVHGILRPGAMTPPDRAAAYTVFVQRSHAALEVAMLKAQASRFFGAKLGITVEKTYTDVLPEADAARVVLASDEGTASGTRLCFGRRADERDHAAAEAAEQRQGTTGMSLLARRCGTVWLVTRESDDDRVALTIAAVLASAFLGPILAPSGDELFGVRTARMKLEGRLHPYR